MRFEYFERVSAGKAACRFGTSAFSPSRVGNANVVQCSAASRGRLEPCVSSSSIVIGGSSGRGDVDREPGEVLRYGSSRWSFPCSRSCMTAVAVNSWRWDAILNFVCGAIGTLPATLARPNPSPRPTSDRDDADDHPRQAAGAQRPSARRGEESLGHRGYPVGRRVLRGGALRQRAAGSRVSAATATASAMRPAARRYLGASPQRVLLVHTDEA